MEKWDNCKFFDDENCHRFPPIIVINQIKTNSGIVTDWVSVTTKTEAQFPSVSRNDWCGEFIGE